VVEAMRTIFDKMKKCPRCKSTEIINNDGEQCCLNCGYPYADLRKMR